MILHCKELVLKTLSHDHPEITKIAEDAAVSKFLTEKWLYPEPMPDSIIFGIESGNEIIGEVALKNIRWYNRKAELSLFLKLEFQGKKIGTEVLKRIMKYAFNTLNFYRLEAEVIDYNEISRKLVEKLSFTLEGRLRQARYFDGKYYDILRYGILKNEFGKFLENNEK
jgi:RimJ/RimL family protein N-acetyltransferase